MAKKISFQKVSAVDEKPVNQVEGNEEESTEDEEEGPKQVETTPWGAIFQSTFGIKVTKSVKNPDTGKMEDQVVYENKAEPFKYPKVNTLVNALIHAGGEFTDDMITKFGEAIGEGNNAAVIKLIKVYNDKLRADAKTSAYQGLVSKHKPLEGQDREVAIAKTIRGFVKLAGISVETAIEVLKSKKAIKEDYTVEDYNATKMRKARGVEEDDED